MLRNIGSVIAGYVLWSLLWVGMNAVLAALLPDHLAPGQAVESAALLAGLLAWSVVASLLAGFVTARIAASRKALCALALGLLLLATGIAVQAGYKVMLPFWYNISFLILLLPATIAGASISKRRNA